MLKFLVYRFVVEYLSNNHLTLKNNHLTLKSTVNTSTSSSIQLQNIPGNIRRYSFQTQQPNSGTARFNSCAYFCSKSAILAKNCIYTKRLSTCSSIKNCTQLNSLSIIYFLYRLFRRFF